MYEVLFRGDNETMKDRVRDIWNANAEYWDGKMGEGNHFHKMLIEPTQLKLLNIKAGDRSLTFCN